MSGIILGMTLSIQAGTSHTNGLLCMPVHAFHVCRHSYCPRGLLAGSFLPRRILCSRMRGPASVPTRRYRLL